MNIGLFELAVFLYVVSFIPYSLAILLSKIGEFGVLRLLLFFLDFIPSVAASLMIFWIFSPTLLALVIFLLWMYANGQMWEVARHVFHLDPYGFGKLKEMKKEV